MRAGRVVQERAEVVHDVALAKVLAVGARAFHGEVGTRASRQTENEPIVQLSVAERAVTPGWRRTCRQMR